MEELYEEKPAITELNRDGAFSAVLKQIIDGEKYLSYSSLSAFKESPKSFVVYQLRERVTTDAMLYGSLVHCMVLEPDKVDKRYAVAPECDKRTTKGKEDFATFTEANKGKQVISDKVFNQAKYAASSVLDNTPAGRLIRSKGEFEKSVEWDYMNLKFRGFLDKYNPKKEIVDLKTCADADPKKFKRVIIDMGYYIQAAMYCIAIGEPVDYKIIAVDKSGGVSVHLLDQNLIEYGVKQYYNLIEKFNSCILLDGFNKSYDFYSMRGDGLYVCDKPSYL